MIADTTQTPSSAVTASSATFEAFTPPMPTARTV